MFKERVDDSKYCLRKVMGVVCLVAGIAIIFIKLFYFMATGTMIPYDGRGTMLVGTGAALLGLTSFDGLLKGGSNGEKGTRVSDD